MSSAKLEYTDDGGNMIVWFVQEPARIEIRKPSGVALTLRGDEAESLIWGCSDPLSKGQPTEEMIKKGLQAYLDNPSAYKTTLEGRSCSS